MKKTTCLIIFLIALNHFSWSQPIVDTSKIALISRNANDSITLRWLTDNFDVLKMGIESGYNISRAEQINGVWSKFNSVATVKSWSKQRWNQYFNGVKDTSSTAYRYGKMAYDIMFDSDAYLPTDLSDIEAIKNAKSMRDLSFLFATLASCNDPVAAEGLALRWVDKTVKQGKKYRYRIDLVKNTSNKPVEGVVIDAQAAPHVSKAKAKIEPIENEDNIILNWTIAEEPMISYSLERSDDDGRTFRRLNKEPILMTNQTEASGKTIGTLADTTVELYKPYIYRIIGNTLFADEAEVGQVKAMARDRTPVSAIFVPNPEHIAGKKAKITWEITGKAEDLVGFKVRRDVNREGKFDKMVNKQLLPARATEFVDETFDPSVSNYYVVETVDTAGNIFRSPPVYLLVVDSTPPAPPVWVNAISDSNGIVTLRLKLNTEKDFMGFRISKANQADHEFSTIVETYTRDVFEVGKDSLFSDTVSLNTLTRDVFYKATALDFHYNESAASKIIRVMRPDTIPPVSPLLTAVEVSDTALVLRITPSSSEDVKLVRVFRQLSNSEEWLPYATLNPSDTYFVDKQVETNVKYTYCVQAIDSSNLASPLSFAMSGTPYDTGLREGVDNLEADYDKDSKEVTVTWNYNPSKVREEKVYFLIYRSIGNSGLERYKSVPNEGSFIFKDTDLDSKGIYKYSVKVITDTGAESELSAKMTAIVE